LNITKWIQIHFCRRSYSNNYTGDITEQWNSSNAGVYSTITQPWAGKCRYTPATPFNQTLSSSWCGKSRRHFQFRFWYEQLVHSPGDGLKQLCVLW